jgi:hypothetical protein
MGRSWLKRRCSTNLTPCVFSDVAHQGAWRLYRALDHRLPHKDALEAHFLAYVLRKTLEAWSQRAGLGRSIPTLREEFGRIQSTDVILPSTSGQAVRRRCVVRSEKDQSILLQRLGLTLPERLLIPKGVA